MWTYNYLSSFLAGALIGAIENISLNNLKDLSYRIVGLEHMSLSDFMAAAVMTSVADWVETANALGIEISQFNAVVHLLLKNLKGILEVILNLEIKCQKVANILKNTVITNEWGIRLLQYIYIRHLQIVGIIFLKIKNSWRWIWKMKF